MISKERKKYLKEANKGTSKGVKNHTKAVLVISRNGMIKKLYEFAKGKINYTPDVNILFRKNLFLCSSISHCYSYTKNQIKQMPVMQ